MSTSPERTVRLVISDVDGTLVTPDKVLTEASQEAVKKLRKAGIAFTITSGRPPKGMRMVIDALTLEHPIASFNGGLLVRPDLSVIKAKLLDSDSAMRSIECIQKYHLDPWIYTDSDWLVLDASRPHVEHESWTVKFPPTVVKGFDQALPLTVKVVGVGDDHDAVAKCEEEILAMCGSKVSASCSQPYYLDVTNKTANKGEVVNDLSELLRIPCEQIATIGDGANDVAMFRRSGISIAMGNASPAVKQAARLVTDANSAEGFANAIERFILADGASINAEKI